MGGRGNLPHLKIFGKVPPCLSEKFWMLVSYESAALYETNAFNRLLISSSVLEMFCQSSVAPAKISNIPIHPSLKKHAQNVHKEIFYLVLVYLTSSLVFSHVNLQVTTGHREKAEHDPLAFDRENWAKIRENPLFSLKSEYLKITFFIQLEVQKC